MGQNFDSLPAMQATFCYCNNQIELGQNKVRHQWEWLFVSMCCFPLEKALKIIIKKKKKQIGLENVDRILLARWLAGWQPCKSTFAFERWRIGIWLLFGNLNDIYRYEIHNICLCMPVHEIVQKWRFYISTCVHETLSILLIGREPCPLII